MGLYTFILENKWILEVLYALVISFICGVVLFKTDKFFRLSLHKGIRYFRNAFLFYGLAFIFRYVFGVLSDFNIDYFFTVRMIFEYALIMAGFFLLYSLIWKKIESPEEEYSSSLFNPKIAVFHIMAIVITMLDILWQTYFFMFISQIVIFVYASVISCINFKKDNNKHKFPKFYFIAMLLGLVAWTLNLVAALYLEWDKQVLIYIGIINIIFFVLFLYGVIKATKNGNKET